MSKQNPRRDRAGERAEHQAQEQARKRARKQAISRSNDGDQSPIQREMEDQKAQPSYDPSTMEYRKSKFKEDTMPSNETPSKRKTSGDEGSSSQNPIERLDPNPEETDSFEASKYAEDRKTRSGLAVHDKAWLYAFLIQTIAYLGATAYINYAAISNDKRPITENSELEPIDLYISTPDCADSSDAVIKLCGAVGVGVVTAFIAFAVSRNLDQEASLMDRS
jgi:hypothetical protein